MTQPLLHHREHFGIIAAFGIKQAIGRETGLGQPRREQIAASQRPQDGGRTTAACFIGTRLAPRQRRQEQGRGGIIGQSSTARHHLVQRRTGQSAPGQPLVDGIDPERQHGPGGSHTKPLDLLNLGP